MDKIWYWKGVALGYPSCCIQYFCRGHAPTELQSKASGHTGFIPCPYHAKQVVRGETCLRNLISNRSNALGPFPDYGNIPSQLDSVALSLKQSYLNQLDSYNDETLQDSI